MENKDLKSIVGQNIYYLRTVNQMTQYELGEKLNYSDKAISKWERGEGLPDLYVVQKLSAIFGVNADYIISEHSEQDKIVDTKPVKSNRRIITNIAIIAVLTIALMIFVSLAIAIHKYVWQVFIYAIPVIGIVSTVFSFVWAKGKGAFFSISAIIIGILLTIYFAVGNYANWMILLIGIPAEIILFLCLRIKITIKFSQKEKSIKPETDVKDTKKEE